ncbi:hypothetical protein DERF_006113 [Dermatophagoides farinae]|uniref:Uncharacterized protein n=1 Tax=Dermatophagoides farinae TaxID=6954 RepID=A0A922L7C4_DERFA|nr:hypothetical protein HUG17_3063 [Dermatophagoides farinae]KAH9522549.1 hypothetical protein DERF_006113 [Dermatophagoides farinae]
MFTTTKIDSIDQWIIQRQLQRKRRLYQYDHFYGDQELKFDQQKNHESLSSSSLTNLHYFKSILKWISSSTTTTTRGHHIILRRQRQSTRQQLSKPTIRLRQSSLPLPLPMSLSFIDAAFSTLLLLMMMIIVVVNSHGKLNDDDDEYILATLFATIINHCGVFVFVLVSQSRIT